jgi:hypothetical protein
MNTSVAFDGTTTNTENVTLQQCLGSPTDGFVLPPYSVARLDWAQ